MRHIKDLPWLRSPTVLLRSIHWSISFLWSYVLLIRVRLRSIPKSFLILRIFLEFLSTLLLEPLILCLVLDLIEPLKDLMIEIKITCGSREACAKSLCSVFICSRYWIALSSVFLFWQLRIVRMGPGNRSFLCKHEKEDDRYSFVDIPIAC